MEITFKASIEKVKTIIPKLTPEQLQNILKAVVYYPHLDCRIGTIKVDDTTIIASNCRIDLTGDIVIGKQCVLSSGVILYTHNHNVNGIEPLLETQVKNGIAYLDKKIEDDVWINTNAIILPHCTHIAKGVLVGAGSIVTKPINEEYSVWAGNPARRVKSRIIL